LHAEHKGEDMTNERQHRLEVILEDMNGKFDLLLEGHATLDRKIDRVHGEASENHRETMAMVKTVHDTLDAKIDSVGDELKGEMGELKREVRAVGEKVDGHEARIRHLEKKVA
jgi:uncharacterized protein YdcH (DUF465 family)